MLSTIVSDATLAGEKKGISSSKRRFVCLISLASLIKGVREIDLIYPVY